MKHLYLIRHGLTEPVKRRLYYGSTDVPLAPEGRRALQCLAAEGGYPDPARCRLATSGMLRAEQTLQCLYGPRPHRRLPQFREMDFGRFEMHAYEELKDWPSYIQWISGDYLRNSTPGGESFQQAAERVRQGLQELLREEEDTILICHGGTILTIMETLFPGRQKSSFDWKPPVGKGYAVDLKGQSYRPIPRAWDPEEAL